MVQTRQMRNNGVQKPIILKYSNRLIIKPGKSRKTLMYCSTGQNSGFPCTWFPCRGIKTHSSYSKSMGKIKKGWIIKPSYGDLYKVLSYDNQVMSYEVRERLSSIEAAVLSCKMGGGFWDSQEGQVATEFIKTLPRYNTDDSQTLLLMRTALDKSDEYTNVTVKEAIDLLF